MCSLVRHVEDIVAHSDAETQKFLLLRRLLLQETQDFRYRLKEGLHISLAINTCWQPQSSAMKSQEAQGEMFLCFSSDYLNPSPFLQPGITWSCFFWESAVQVSLSLFVFIGRSVHLVAGCATNFVRREMAWASWRIHSGSSCLSRMFSPRKGNSIQNYAAMSVVAAFQTARPLAAREGLKVLKLFTSRMLFQCLLHLLFLSNACDLCQKLCKYAVSMADVLDSVETSQETS